MTSRRVLIGFGAGFVVAGAVAGLARIAGLDEPPAAIADVEAPAAAPKPATAAEAPGAAQASAAAQEVAPAPARAQAKPSRRWRAPRKAADDVPAGVIARVASRRGVERARCAPAEAKDRAAEGAAGATPTAEPCADDAGRVESVEMDWHGPASKP